MGSEMCIRDRSLFLQIFRRSKSFLLGWKKLLVIIVAGLILGYFQTDSKLPNAKEATVLVKINFDAGNYVYDAVDLINLKISSADYDFFNQEIKLNEDESVDEGPADQLNIRIIWDFRQLRKICFHNYNIL